jgi:Ulp1 family protease
MQVMFPVLQDLTPDIKLFNGHYYLIVLNLKAERFEVFDSIRAKGNRGLQKDYRAIIGSIKYMWDENYSESKIKIDKWPTVHIDTPMQKTT